MEIRKAVTGEENEVVRIINEVTARRGLLPPLPLDDAASMIRSYIDGDLSGSVIVAFDGPNLYGVCTITYQPSIRTLGVYGIIQDIYVSFGFRTDSMIERLLTGARSEAKNAGCTWLELNTNRNDDHQDQTTEFFRIIGYVPIGDRMLTRL